MLDGILHLGVGHIILQRVGDRGNIVLIGVGAGQPVDLYRRGNLLCFQISDGGYGLRLLSVGKLRADPDSIRPRRIQSRTRNGDAIDVFFILRHRVHHRTGVIAPVGHFNLNRILRDRRLGNIHLIVSDFVELRFEDSGAFIVLGDIGRERNIRVQPHHCLAQSGRRRNQQEGLRIFDFDLDIPRAQSERTVI